MAELKCYWNDFKPYQKRFCPACGRIVPVPLSGTKVCPNCGEEELPLMGSCYVNAYGVTREYGGPEEGGWWYDRGTPVASLWVEADEAEKAADELKARYDHIKEGDLSSVLGGTELWVKIEDHFAAPWPATRPHYE